MRPDSQGGRGDPIREPGLPAAGGLFAGTFREQEGSEGEGEAADEGEGGLLAGEAADLLAGDLGVVLELAGGFGDFFGAFFGGVEGGLAGFAGGFGGGGGGLA